MEDIQKGHERVVDTIKATIWQTGLNTNNISSTMNHLNNKGTMKEVNERMETATKVSDQMRIVRHEAMDISRDVYKLKMKLSALDPQWDTKFGLAEENSNIIFTRLGTDNDNFPPFLVSQSQSNILATRNILSNIESMAVKNIIKFDRWNSSMGGQLQELRDKIAKSRHAAEGVSMQHNQFIIHI